METNSKSSADSDKPGGADAIAGAEKPQSQERSAKRVLVVEEDPATGELLQAILEDEVGYHTQWVTSMSEAFGSDCPGVVSRTRDLDLLLVDASLLDARDLTLLKALPSKGVALPPVLLMSSAPMTYAEEAAEQINAAGLIVKPFDLDMLISEVNKALRSRPGN